MDEELKKRSTDCVYFLASPLTCKKGIECEYRHSETARLNPRDCWYWLAGICLNPSCAFRHPPLDVHTEVLSESAPPQYQLSAPVNKSNTPCYFYFNGFCNKGVRCPFLHGPCEDGTPGWKSSKTASAVNGAPPLENKTSAVSDAISTPIETLPNPSEAASKRAAELQINPKPDVHVSAHTNVKDISVSPHMSESECEEAATVRSQTLPPGIDLIESRSIVSTEQSSEEDDVDCLLEREDCLESSPGFDVLVDDDRLQNLGYEEDLEHLLSVDRDEGGRNDNFSRYDYEDPVEDDSLYPDTRLFYEKERDDCSDQFNHRGRYEFIREFHGHTRERMLEPILPRKRKSFPANLGSGDQGRGDLRNRLKKRRRVIDGRRVTRFSKRNDKSFLVDGIRERPRKLGAPWLSRRLNSEVHCERVGSFSKYGNGLHPSRPRQRYVERRQPRQKFLSSEVSGKPVSRNRRSTEEKSNVFTGPKSLAQIREEKSKTTENGNSSGRPWNSSRTTTEEFQGPKPLSAILKERKKLGSVIDASNYNS